MARGQDLPQFYLLVVEDNLADIRLIQEALNIKNTTWIDIIAATDGQMALEILTKQGIYTDAPTPNLVLLDLNMPKLSGLELLKKIKSNVRLKNIPVVVFTSSRSHIDIEASYNLQANAYVVKPSDIDTFLEVVNSIQYFWMRFAEITPHQIDL